MVRCGEGRRLPCALLALVVAVALCALAPTVARGARGGGNGALIAPGQVDAGGLARELGATGQVDPLSGLGIRNPVCDQLAQIQERATRLSCEADGTPESNYPASNYGFDIFIETGFTHPIGDITYGFATVLNGIWLALIFVLKLVLSLLGLAFGLNPFGEGQTMSRISAAVLRLYARITDPWLSTLIVCGGIWFAYKGLVKREVAAGVAGTLAAIAMLVLGLWVVHQPRESVGRLASLSDEVALGTISAPESGSFARPVGTYAEAMSRTWTHLVEVPFAGLDFSDVKWALGPPPAEAVKKADEKFCGDFGALALLALLSQIGSDEAKEACAHLAATRYGKPKRVIDLYLRSSPGSPARKALWDYFDGNNRYKSKVAAQGGDGVLTRLSMLALIAIGLLGGLLLLAWLAIRLFTQAAIAFVLLLAAPFALFFPMLGDAGRRAFKTWGLTLFGAIVAKVIYAAFLSVVLLGISILGSVNGPSTGFLLTCAFTWSVFLKRAELIGWMSIGDLEGSTSRGFGFGHFAAMRIAGRMARVPTGAARGLAHRVVHLGRGRAALGAEVTRETARSSLRGSARALADQRYREARETVSAAEARPPAAKRGEKGVTGAKRTRRPGGAPAKPEAPDTRQAGPGARPEAPGTQHAAAGAGAKAVAPAPPSAERYRQAKELVARADRNQSRLGQRWSDRDLERFEAEDRKLLESSRDPTDHAHRAGYERTQFEALQGPERERAEQEIEKARKRDSRRVPVASEVPGRIVGRARQAAERARQGAEQLGGATVRREHLHRLRRDRRSRDHLAPRRNLSRGA
jgi:hypothetical protein